MSKFKVGDEVRVLKSLGGKKIGEMEIIEEIHGDQLVFESGFWGNIYSVELINQPADLYPGEVACVDEKTGQVDYVKVPTAKYTSEEYIAFVSKTLEEMQTLIKAKNADYTNGAGPFANFEVAEDFGVDPFQGLMLRVSDKMQRIKSYCKQGNLQVKGEGVDDCFRDLIGYSLIALAMLNEKRGKK